jgi:hypothetical protein
MDVTRLTDDKGYDYTSAIMVKSLSFSILAAP